MNNIREHVRMALAITRKDIADALTNRMFLVGFLLPPFMSVLFTIIFINEINEESVRISVYDPEGTRVIEILRETEGVTVVDAANADQVPAAVEDDADAGIVVPSGFDASVEAGSQPELTLYVNQEGGVGTENSINRLLQAVLRQAAGQTPPAEIVITRIGEPTSAFLSGNASLKHFFMVILLVLALITIGVNMMPNMMIEEKERHTLDAILVSPASPVDVVLGKAILGMLFMAIDTAILLFMNEGWVGQWPLTLLVIFLGSLMLVLIGLLFGIMFKRQVTASMWSTVVMMILIIPTWFVSGGPDFVRMFTRALPTYYIVHGIQQTITGTATFANLGLDLAVLMGASVILFGMVVWAQARQEV